MSDTICGSTICAKTCLKGGHDAAQHDEKTRRQGQGVAPRIHYACRCRGLDGCRSRPVVRFGGAGPAQTGGTFKLAIGHGATTDTLDPATWKNTFVFTIVVVFPRRHIDRDRPEERGQAASRRKLRAGRRRRKWMFKLRKGVTFHNGKTVTADRRRRDLQLSPRRELEVGRQIGARHRRRHQGRRRRRR